MKMQKVGKWVLQEDGGFIEALSLWTKRSVLRKLFSGQANEILKHLTELINIDGVYWNRWYEPWRIDRDKQIKLELQETGIEAKSFNASLLLSRPKLKK